MTNQQKFYDVYVSYPPGDSPDRINQCLIDNLSEEEANDIINALATQKQVIIAEHCTNEERENAQHYFTYLGLDVIIRLSLELADNGLSENGELTDPIPQCPVCHTILENPEIKECPTCTLPFNKLSEQQIQRKRIEWQERVAFEHRKKHEIAYKLMREKQEEEKLLRREIRAELEQQLMSELGRYHGWKKWFYGKYAFITIISLIIFLMVLLALFFALSGFMSSQKQEQPPAQHIPQTQTRPVVQNPPAQLSAEPPAPSTTMETQAPSTQPAVVSPPDKVEPSPNQNNTNTEETFGISVPSIVPASEVPPNNGQ